MKNFSIQWILPMFLIGMLSIAIASCGGSKEENKGSAEQKKDTKKDEDVKALEDEVMRIHDEVMPKDKNIQHLKEELKALRDTLSPMEESDTAQRIGAAVEKLKRGHKVMMDWMHQFEKPQVGDAKEKAMNYLQGQKEKIQAVRDSMLNSIENAKQVLKDFRGKKKKEGSENS